MWLSFDTGLVSCIDTWTRHSPTWQGMPRFIFLFTLEKLHKQGIAFIFLHLKSYFLNLRNMHVSTCRYVCSFACLPMLVYRAHVVCMYVKAGGQLWVHFSDAFHLVLDNGSLASLNLTNYVWMDSQWAPGICSYLSPQHCTVITSANNHARLSHMGTGN